MNSSPSYLSTSSWFSNSEIEESNNKNRAKWTAAENKAFEEALALYDQDSPDRWRKVAEMVPGKTVSDVIRQYKELEDDVSSIEAGLMDLVPIDETPSFTLEWAHRPPAFLAGGKRSPATRPSEHERKKGVPWTEDEHKLFLMGLKKHGKGDWRNISRNFVITRTPTQVASHAQKFFIRQNSGGKDKRRASIHDITTVNLDDPHHRTAKKLDNSPSDHQQHHQIDSVNDNAVQRRPFVWNHHQGNIGNLFSSPYGLGQSIFGSQAIGFPIQSAATAQQYPFA